MIRVRPHHFPNAGAAICNEQASSGYDRQGEDAARWRSRSESLSPRCIRTVPPEPDGVFECAESECDDLFFTVQGRRPMVLITDMPDMPEFRAPFFKPLRTG